MKALYAGLLTAFLLAAAGGTGNAVSISVSNPREDLVYHGHTILAADVRGITGLVVVKVEYAGVTQYVAGSSDARGIARITNEYMPVVMEPAELRLTVYRAGSSRELASASLTVNNEVSDEDWWRSNVLDGFARERSAIKNSAEELEDAWRSFLQVVARSQAQDSDEQMRRISDAGFSYARWRCWDFHNRIAQYSRIAEGWIRMGKMGEARKAADVAREIFDREKGVVLPGEHFGNVPIMYNPRNMQTAPNHFRLMARMAVLSSDTDEALGWLSREQEFYHQQAAHGHLDEAERGKCLAAAADSMREAAIVSMIISGDVDEYARLMHEAARLDPR